MRELVQKMLIDFRVLGLITTALYNDLLLAPGPTFSLGFGSRKMFTHTWFPQNRFTLKMSQ